MTQRHSTIGMGVTWRWYIVWLRCPAGAFVVASAVGLAIWSFLQMGDYASLDDRLMNLWYTFVSIAWGGVAVILLAEVVNRLVERAPRVGD